MEEKKQVTCEERNCRLKGFWVEDLPTGDKLICFKVPHRGELHVKKIRVREIIKEAR